MRIIFLGDGVHPSQTDVLLIADEWLKSFKEKYYKVRKNI